MSAPELRDGDTIWVRATVKTFIRRVNDGDGPDELVPTAHINDSAWRLEDLTGGWCIEDRKIAVGDRVKVNGKFDTVGDVIAASPPEVTPPQYWVRFPESWVLKTFTREQLERFPVA